MNSLSTVVTNAIPTLTVCEYVVCKGEVCEGVTVVHDQPEHCGDQRYPHPHRYRLLCLHQPR